jgi:hypothetical protein
MSLPFPSLRRSAAPASAGGTIPPDALRVDGYSNDMTQRLCGGDNSAFGVAIFEM